MLFSRREGKKAGEGREKLGKDVSVAGDKLCLITEKPWSWIRPVGRVGLLNLWVSQTSPVGWKGHPSGVRAPI